jgi:hypothetical protein
MIAEAAALADWMRAGIGAVTPKSVAVEPSSDVIPDFFICHASEDKESVVFPLRDALESSGYRVWVDASELTIGDSLRETIDRLIASCRFGIVVLSASFFERDWPQTELNGLFARQMRGRKTILPVWHNVDAATVAQYAPMIADRLAADTSDGIETVASQIIAAFNAASRADMNGG